MAEYRLHSKEDLTELLIKLNDSYTAIKAKSLSLDMSRGKPNREQLELSSGLLTTLTTYDQLIGEGGDYANYGLLTGTPEGKEWLGNLLELPAKNIFVGGNSSLSLMHDCLSFAFVKGFPQSSAPWGKQPVKFLCPSPGYDRHFAMADQFGIQLIPVEMTSQGPHMDEVEELIKDEAVKGIWCVPKYSNPTGITYSDDIVRRLAAMKPAAADFKIFWDNAYMVHHLDPQHPDQLLPLMTELEKHGHEDHALLFCSTSKVTFPGSGISALGASDKLITWFTENVTYQNISYDKINQLRHVRFLPTMADVDAHMAKQAKILQPKFQMVLDGLSTLTEDGIARWENPKGGYFITLTVLGGCAKRVVDLCREAGVVMTPAGAPYPYGNDPKDETIRIAPSYPSLDELQQATELLCLCVQLASVEHYLAPQNQGGHAL